jgi:hypothetical protein
MKVVPGFRLFHGSPAEVEGELNIWAESLGPGTKIRRTQMAAVAPVHVPPLFPGGAVVFVLVNYEPPGPA